MPRKVTEPYIHWVAELRFDKLYRYENPEANLNKAPQGKVVYDDLPPYIPHGWKYLVPDGKGWFYIPVGVPCNICQPPTSTGQRGCFGEVPY